MAGNVTITAGGNLLLGIIPVGLLDLNLAQVLYKYANPAMAFNPGDPGLTFTYLNTKKEPHVNLCVKFFNLLDEFSPEVQIDVGTAVFPVAVTGGECLDVRAFGAVGDGLADDTVPVQLALDTAAANAAASGIKYPTPFIARPTGPVGPTKVCIPSGVKTRVGGTLNRYGGNPIIVATGVHFQIDGALIADGGFSALMNDYLAKNGGSIPAVNSQIHVVQNPPGFALNARVELFGRGAQGVGGVISLSPSVHETLTMGSTTATSQNFYDEFLYARATGRFSPLSGGQLLFQDDSGNTLGTITVDGTNPNVFSSEMTSRCDADIRISGDGQIVGTEAVQIGSVVRFSHDGPDLLDPVTSNERTAIFIGQGMVDSFIGNARCSILLEGGFNVTADGIEDDRWLSTVGFEQVEACTIRNCSISNGGGIGVEVLGTASMTSGTLVSGNHTRGNFLQPAGILVQNMQGVRLVGNESSGNLSLSPPGHGIALINCAQCAVVGSIANDNEGAPVFTSACANCLVSETAGEGNGIQQVTDAGSIALTQDNPEIPGAVWQRAGITVPF